VEGRGRMERWGKREQRGRDKKRKGRRGEQGREKREEELPISHNITNVKTTI